MTSGLVTLPTPHAADTTFKRLRAAIEIRGLTVFATVDHAAEAARAGLAMPFASLIIFGSPKAGTPLMKLAPTLAIDLPIKALVWSDEGGATWLTYNGPAWTARRHEVAPSDAPAAWDLDLDGPSVVRASRERQAIDDQLEFGAVAGPMITAMTNLLSELARETLSEVLVA